MRPRVVVRCLVVVAAVAIPHVAACDSAACALSTRVGDRRLEPGRWRVDVSLRYADEGRGLFRGQAVDEVWHQRVDLAQGRVERFVHRAKAASLGLAQIDVARGVNRWLTLRGAFPFYRRRTADVLDPVPVRHDVRGLGDVQVGADATLRSDGRRDFGVGATLKLPTGRSDVADRYGVVDPMLQPGTGSLDGVLSAYGAQRVVGGVLSATVSYQKTTANGDGYRHGDEAVVTVTGARRVGNALTATLQVKAHYAARHSFRGQGVLATGARAAQVIAGGRLRVGGSTLYATAQLPLVTRVNESQLVSRLTATAGVLRTF